MKNLFAARPEVVAEMYALFEQSKATGRMGNAFAEANLAMLKDQ